MVRPFFREAPSSAYPSYPPGTLFVDASSPYARMLASQYGMPSYAYHAYGPAAPMNGFMPPPSTGGAPYFGRPTTMELASPFNPATQQPLPGRDGPSIVNSNDAPAFSAFQGASFYPQFIAQQHVRQTASSAGDGAAELLHQFSSSPAEHRGPGRPPGRAAQPPTTLAPA